MRERGLSSQISKAEGHGRMREPYWSQMLLAPSGGPSSMMVLQSGGCESGLELVDLSIA
jgi:hypothetical protein